MIGSKLAIGRNLALAVLINFLVLVVVRLLILDVACVCLGSVSGEGHL
jgi:hypothetical protein